MARITADKLHPKARAIVDEIAALPQLPTLTPAEARGRPAPLEAAPEAVASVTARTIPGPGGFLGIRIYRPKDALRAALVYFHGGGWVIGSLDSADGSCRALANRSRCVVVSIAYRLARKRNSQVRLKMRTPRSAGQPTTRRICGSTRRG